MSDLDAITAKFDARWAAREARKAELEQQAVERRRAHVATVYQAYVMRWPSRSRDELMPYAESAVEALEASGVVFARIGSWDDE